MALAAETAARARTREALNTLIDDVTSRLLFKQAALGDEERAFLRKTLSFYQEFAADAGDSAEARAVAADGQYRVAEIWDLLGDSKEAVDGYREALRRWEALAAEFPGEPDYRFGVSKSYAGWAGILWQDGKWEEAVAEYQKALGIQDKLVVDFPKVAKHREEQALSSTHSDRGLLGVDRRGRGESGLVLWRGPVLREACEDSNDH